MRWFDKHLQTINRCLIGVIIVLNGYVLLAPVKPAVEFRINQAIKEPLNVAAKDDLSKVSRDSDHLIIPRLRLDKPVFVGSSPNLVHRGIWHRPATSTPDKGSNTVLVGHRFSYRDPAIFYNLDKVRPNDPIVLVWKGKLYVYKVHNVRIVPATAVSVEDATTDNQLTLYTCDPLWSAKNRLVVNAKLEKTL